MNTIFARSPYFISVNETGQTGAKIEIFLWDSNPATVEPTTPNYVLTEGIPSLTNREIVFNISPFIKEILDPYGPDYDASAPKAVSARHFQTINVRVKTYKLVSGVYTLVDNLRFFATNGYSDYLQGSNYDYAQNYGDLPDGILVPLKENNRTWYYPDNNPFTLSRGINILIDHDGVSDTIVTYTGQSPINVLTSVNPAGYYNTLIPIHLYANANGLTEFVVENTASSNTFTARIQRVCEPKFTPVIVDFVNKLGGWDFITFFKTRTDSTATDSKPYNLGQKRWDYDVTLGQKKEFNFSQTRTVKLSTGFVPEYYGALIEQLMASGNVLLDTLPALVKTKTQTIKSQLNNRLINYEVEFEMNYNLINDMQ